MKTKDKADEYYKGFTITCSPKLSKPWFAIGLLNKELVVDVSEQDFNKVFCFKTKKQLLKAIDELQCKVIDCVLPRHKGFCIYRTKDGFSTDWSASGKGKLSTKQRAMLRKLHI
jgi:hypothetical protein